MKQVLELADNYIKSCSWKELALIKFCMCSVGMLIGMSVCKKHKKAVGVVAAVVFIATYIPLMIGFFKSIDRG